MLSDDLHHRITALTEEGDDLVDANDYIGALRKYDQAWALLPEPKEDLEVATWLLSAIADAHFFAGDFKNAVSALAQALRCPDGPGNPFLHLRLGQSYFELGDVRRAQDELTRAYMCKGRDIFKDEDPKYFALLQTILKPPAGQCSL
jgi:tetratricopeptide (TPR) repeat protein